MRIALATYSTRPRGSVVHTFALAEALAELGQSVTVFALDRSGEGPYRWLDPLVDLRLVRCEDSDDVELRILRSIAALQAAVQTERFDVVHAQDCIAANALGERCLRTVHHVDEFSTPALVRCHAAGISRPSDLVCVSDPVAGELERDWGRTAEVIPNGVDAQRFAVAASGSGTAGRAAWRERLGSAREIVLCVGGIEPRKGSLDLLDAFGELRRRRPRARLVIAGGETLFDYREYREAFEERRRAMAADVEVLGPVGDADLPALIATADVFAMPSVKEGFGLAAMEALAARVPVVLRDTELTRAVFGESVAYGATPEEIAFALDDSLAGGAADRAEPGFELAAEHSWTKAARAHIDLYSRIRAGARLTHA